MLNCFEKSQPLQSPKLNFGHFWKQLIMKKSSDNFAQLARKETRCNKQSKKVKHFCNELTFARPKPSNLENKFIFRANSKSDCDDVD